jgi:predicted lipase
MKGASNLLLLIAVLGAFMVGVSCSSQYDPEIAKESWIYCLASYCPQRSIELWKAAKMSQMYPNITGVRVIYNEAENTLAYLSYNYKDNVINIVFRGTEPWSITNWINNLDVLRKKYVFCEGCEVHSGFFENYMNLEADVLKNLEEMRAHYPSAKVRITGHSLGAAFALFAALEIQRSIGEVDAFYTFGLPRVGNDKFALFVNSVFEGKMTPRITNGRDPSN